MITGGWEGPISKHTSQFPMLDYQPPPNINNNKKNSITNYDNKINIL